MSYSIRIAAIVCSAGAILGGAAAHGQAPDPREQDGMPLVFQDSFDQGTGHWEMTDAAAWAVVKEQDNPVLQLQKSSDYEPEVRSPKSIAWVKGLDVGDFVLEVDARQTGREYGHRDLCFFFGKKDASHFYYVHLATKADEHANSIFLVNGAPRVSIAATRTEGTGWGGDVWHKIRIVRSTDSGRIEVFFDDMEKPVMTAEDKTFVSGPIGLGSFDDVGWFDNVRVWGKRASAGADPAAP